MYVTIVNVRVYVNKDFIRVLNEINRIVQSIKCQEFLESVAGVGSKIQQNITDIFVKCLKDVKNKLSTFQIITSEESKTQQNISNFTKCFTKCLKIIQRYSKLFKSIDQLYNASITALTTHGDSIIKQSETPSIVKRIARHLEIDPSLTIVHVTRYGLAKSMLNDFTQCMINECGIEEVKKYFEDLVNNILTRSNEDNDIIKLVLDKMNQWCKEYKIC